MFVVEDVGVAKMFATRLSLIAFTVAVIEAIVLGQSFQDGLVAAGTRAAWFFGIGLIVGEICRRVVEENAAAEFASLGNEPEMES